uniref:Uncharacterized protein n=1 Tax=Anguilla anguilla TaxID=7936 RepID=A0A0E9XU45_ANGAN
MISTTFPWFSDFPNNAENVNPWWLALYNRQRLTGSGNSFCIFLCLSRPNREIKEDMTN